MSAVECVSEIPEHILKHALILHIHLTHKNRTDFKRRACSRFP